MPGQNFGPAAFPGLVAVGLAVCSLLLIVQACARAPRRPWFAAGEWMRRPAQLVAFLVTVGGLVFYMLASDKLGFLIIGTLIVCRADAGAARARVVALPVALVATLAIHLAFYKGCACRCPGACCPCCTDLIER